MNPDMEREMAGAYDRGMRRIEFLEGCLVDMRRDDSWDAIRRRRNIIDSLEVLYPIFLPHVTKVRVDTGRVC